MTLVAFYSLTTMQYVAQKNRRSEPVREDTARREEPPRKVQATGPVSIFAEKFVFPKKSPISQFPTPVLLLLVRISLSLHALTPRQNMAGAGNFDPQLEADTSSECSRFGRVVRCVVKVYPGAIEDEVTRIFVRFADVASAERGARASRRLSLLSSYRPSSIQEPRRTLLRRSEGESRLLRRASLRRRVCMTHRPYVVIVVFVFAIVCGDI